MYFYCTDMEGVITPEIWIMMAEKTGIEELKLTTRDVADYHELMKHRLTIMNRHHIKLADIVDVIKTIEPLDGALGYLNWLRSRMQVAVISDTYEEFAGPLMDKLNRPTLICHTLEVDKDGVITGYRLRQENGKQKTIAALQSLNYKVIATGDSYNDINMLKKADYGILFKPPKQVQDDFPHLPVASTYEEMKDKISTIMAKTG